jgi:hypothetical protein
MKLVILAILVGLAIGVLGAFTAYWLTTPKGHLMTSRNTCKPGECQVLEAGHLWCYSPQALPANVVGCQAPPTEHYYPRGTI